MHNFQSVMQIMSSLESTPISRLTKCWTEVGKTTGVYAELKEHMKTEKNYKQYRKMLSTITGPCLPFLGKNYKEIVFF